MLELTITFCLLAIVSSVAFNLYSDRADTVAEASGKSRLQVAVTAQDVHLSNYGSFASATDLENIKGVLLTANFAGPGEISVSLSDDRQQVGMATIEGNICISVGINASYDTPVFSSFRSDYSTCSGSLGLDSL